MGQCCFKPPLEVTVDNKSRCPSACCDGVKLYCCVCIRDQKGRASPSPSPTLPTGIGAVAAVMQSDSKGVGPILVHDPAQLSGSRVVVPLKIRDPSHQDSEPGHVTPETDIYCIPINPLVISNDAAVVARIPGRIVPLPSPA